METRMGRGVLLLTVVLVMMGVIVESKPGLRRTHQRSSYGSFGGFDSGALSASSYDSLGIQPSHRSSKHQARYWLTTFDARHDLYNPHATFEKDDG